MSINGDTRQSDLGSGSGLVDAASRLAGLNGVYIHEFEAADILRSGLVRCITVHYETGQPVAGYPAGPCISAMPKRAMPDTDRK